MELIDRKNIVLTSSFEFAKYMVHYCKLIEVDGHRHIAWQLLRSGTSIGANIFEAQSPESKRDFIHKMKIASKECQETIYWLLLIKETIEPERSEEFLNKALSIARLLTAIISTSQKSLKT